MFSVCGCICKEKNRSVLPCSKYGLHTRAHISIGVPVILGKNGVERILELKLSPEAKKQFEKSVSIIKDMINKLEDNPAQILNLDRKR